VFIAAHSGLLFFFLKGSVLMRSKFVAFAAALLLLTGCQSSSNNGGADGMGGAGGMGQVTPGSQADLVQNVGDRVFFDYDSSTLSSEARSVLDRQADWMGKYSSVKAVVEGHCDERGTREYNLALGERRASAVRNYLIAKGVAGDRVGTISYGKERPEVLGSDESSWARNRRGVTTVQ
jgi:peptidoglycan-associated lipoprotein